MLAAPHTPSSDAWSLRSEYDVGYPWPEAVLHVDGLPMPGSFWPADGRGGDALVRDVLGIALFMAGADPKLAFAEGKHPDAQVARGLRRSVREAIVIPGGVNDRLYGQTDPSLAGGTHLLNSEGRGLNWQAVHANNLERVQWREPLIRATKSDGTRLPWPRCGQCTMLLWIAAFDLNELAQQTPQIRPLTWGSGGSTIDPPDPITVLGDAP